MTKHASESLSSSRVEVAAETFTLISMDREAWKKLLERPELSPRMSAPFMIFMDSREVTLLLDDADMEAIRPGIDESVRVERGFRMLTFDLPMDFEVIGFIAEVSRILAAAGVPILPLSAFSRDHILVKQNDLATTLRALGPHVADLC
jgi:hypothetical protein